MYLRVFGRSNDGGQDIRRSVVLTKRDDKDVDLKGQGIQIDVSNMLRTRKSCHMSMGQGRVYMQSVSQLRYDYRLQSQSSHSVSPGD